jgi:hypothetical protein
MKRFIIKAFFLGLSALLMLGGRDLLLDDVSTWHFADDVYLAIELSQKPTSYRKVILGDSVARQLFHPERQPDSDYYHLTSNQAISMLGQYILLENYLKHNASNTEEVVLVMLPESFDSNLDNKWTFTYFLLPFFSEENEQYISEYASNQIEKYPFYFLSRFKQLRYIAKYLRIDYSQFKGDSHHTHEYYLSPISIQYIRRMNKLCDEHNITFRVLPSPLPDEHRNDDYLFMMEQVNDNGLNGLFGEYFQKLSYYPDEVFHDDGLHFREDYLDANLLTIIGNMGL